MIATGSALDDVARALGITPPTLAKHFAEEIANGRAKKRAEVLQAMMTAARKGNATAQAKLLEAFDRADLADIEKSIGAAPDDRSKAEPPVGKKLEAKRAAQRELATGEWGELLSDDHVHLQ